MLAHLRTWIPPCRSARPSHACTGHTCSIETQCSAHTIAYVIAGHTLVCIERLLASGTGQNCLPAALVPQALVDGADLMLVHPQALHAVRMPGAPVAVPHGKGIHPQAITHALHSATHMAQHGQQHSVAFEKGH